MNSRIEQITRSIDQYGTDSFREGFDAGYDEAVENSSTLIDEAWDEARNKGYDEGWVDACEHIMNKVLNPRSGLVVTPQTVEQAAEIIEQFSENGPLCVMAYNNFIVDRIQQMKTGS